MRRKSEVYSWRVSPVLKASLEDAARRERSSVARLLEKIVQDHLRKRGDATEDDEEQERIRARVRRFAGAISGSDPTRSSRVSELVRARLMRKHAR
jgi:hypothetical protein